MKMRKGFLYRAFSEVPGKAILVALLVLPTIAAQAQSEADNWIFGNHAWLKFPGGGGSPVSLSGAVINTQEGSSSISDQSGNLLFSTDGLFVWNRKTPTNQQMPNGSGLLGASSATQSALIVPWPDNKCRRYFIFTVEDMAPQKQQKLNYSVVDMSLAGGLGDVTTKNTLLKTSVSEKLAAVKDSSGAGFWVVAHGFRQPDPTNLNPSENKEFYAYHVTSAGVSAPVLSTVGTAHQSSTGAFQASAGQMKISPDGKLIACAVNGVCVEILNFNSSTGGNGGKVTGPGTMFPASSAPFQEISTYGLEFSSNSNFLYVATLTAPSRLFQYNILSPTWTLLATGVPAQTNYDIGQLQLGPDKKIYVARDTKNYIGVIQNPDLPGTSCNFLGNGPSLPTSNSRLGLPTMIGGNFSCSSTPTPTPTATPVPTATPDPCCPPWNTTWLKAVLFHQALGSISGPYTLLFQPSPSFQNQMQSYINYLYSVSPNITKITIEWRLHDQGTGNLPATGGWGPQIPPGGSVWTQWTQGGNGTPIVTNPGFFNQPTAYPMVVGTWYAVTTGIYLENGQHFFPDRCAVVTIYYRIQLLPKTRGQAVLEISDGKKTLKSIPLTDTKKQ